jgi:hypothetical protein
VADAGYGHWSCSDPTVIVGMPATVPANVSDIYNAQHEWTEECGCEEWACLWNEWKEVNIRPFTKTQIRIPSCVYPPNCDGYLMECEET